MQELKRLPPKKTWRLMRNTVTGHVFTDYYHAKNHIESMIATAKAERAKGVITPDGSVHTPSRYENGRWVYDAYTGPCLSDVELLDYLPVLRVTLKFGSLYNGTSGVAIRFLTQDDRVMVLRSTCSDQFFKLVGAGKILMDSAGFYTFDVEFVKGGDKVYMELYGYDE